MKIGVFDTGWWSGACDVLGHSIVTMPTAPNASGNAYAADLGARVQNGLAVAEIIQRQQPELLLDNGGVGLSLCEGPGQPANLQLVHEQTGVPLYSHFIDPMVTAFQGLDWGVLCSCLKSESWIKAVWDRAQVAELRQFGIPSVAHLPMAAPDRPYNTAPLDPQRARPVISFVGGQNTSFFFCRPSGADRAAPARHACPRRPKRSARHVVFRRLLQPLRLS